MEKQRRKTAKLWSITDPKTSLGFGKGLNKPFLRQETRCGRNPQLNGVEIQFSEKPPDEVKALIQLHGFRLARNRKLGRIFWWAKATPERLKVAEEAVRLYKSQEVKPDDAKPGVSAKGR